MLKLDTGNQCREIFERWVWSLPLIGLMYIFHKSLKPYQPTLLRANFSGTSFDGVKMGEIELKQRLLPI